VAYFVNAQNRFISEVSKALSDYFGKRAKITFNTENKTITIDINEGFEQIIDRLSGDAIKRGICGGGFREGLNGKTFVLKLEK
jgi:hypothetical protein